MASPTEAKREQQLQDQVPARCNRKARKASDVGKTRKTVTGAEEPLLRGRAQWSALSASGIRSSAVAIACACSSVAQAKQRVRDTKSTAIAMIGFLDGSLFVLLLQILKCIILCDSAAAPKSKIISGLEV